MFALGVLVFAALTWQVASHGTLVDPDWTVLRWFDRMSAANSWFTPTAHNFCKLGNIQVAVPVLVIAICLTGWLGRRAALPRWWLPPAAGLLVVAVLPVVVTVVKDAVHRPAPGQIVPEPGYGYFPSGHTATSAVAYGAAALLLLPWVRSRAARLVLLVGTPLLLFAVGFCLVWCDYHWPLDVLASWCLTLSLLTVVAAAQVGLDRAIAAGAAAVPEPVSCSSGTPG